SLTRSGAHIAGTYTLLEQTSATFTSWDRDTNQTLTKSIYETGSDASTKWESGNEVKGDYSLTEKDWSTATLAETATKQSLTGVIRNRREYETELMTRTGNHLLGYYSLTEYSSTTYSALETDTNQSLLASITQQGSDTSSLYQSGDEIQGGYTLTELGFS